MREQATVWFWLAEKERPGVVIEARPDLVRVAYGTHNEVEGVEGPLVPARSRAGKRFPLREPTYFYGANTAWCVPAELRAGEGECVGDLYREIRKRVEEHDARDEAED